MDRSVTLTIKVKDGEVKDAEAALKRLENAANNVQTSSLGKDWSGPDKAISAAAKRAGKSYEEMAARFSSKMPAVQKAADAVSSVGEASSAAAGGIGEASASLGGLGAAAGPVGIAIAAVALVVAGLGIAAVALGKKIFELVKQFADYTIELRNTAEGMGLTMRATQALRHEFEAQGRSFGDLQSGMMNFRKTIGEAAAGSNDARRSLKLLGLDAQKAMGDIDLAFKTAVTAIVNAKTPVDQVRLALAAFGDDGYKLIPFLKEFGGNVDAVIAKARQLGLTVGDTKEAQEFKRAYADVQAQFQLFERTLATTVLPTVNQFFKEFSGWLGDNKIAVSGWATSIANAINGVMIAFKDLGKFIADHPYLFRISAGIATWGMSEAAIGMYQGFEQIGQQNAPKSPAGLNPMTSGITSHGPGGTPDLYAIQSMLNYKPPKGPKSGTEPFALSSRAKALIDAAEKLGILPLDLATIISYETGGTFSPSIMGGKGGNYQGLIQFGPSERRQYGVTKGQSFEDQILGPVVRFLTDRFASVGRSTQGATILDLYKTINGGNPNVSANASDGNGNIRDHVVRMMGSNRQQALRYFFGGSTGNIPQGFGDDVDRMMSKQSDDLTKAQRDGQIRQLQHIYEILSLVPDEGVAKLFQGQLAENARKSGVAQPTTADIINAYKQGQAANAQPIDAGRGGTANLPIQARRTEDEEWLDTLNDGLRTEEKINNAIFIERNLKKMISAYVQDDIAARREALKLAEVEAGVLAQRNLADEAGLRALQERNSLVRQIGDLQIAIANAGVNDSLVIEAEHLKDIINLRNRELDATIRINRAQLELSQSMKISGNQIKADVLEHISQQANLNQSIAAGINGTFDAISLRMDEQIDKMFEWAGLFKSLFAEPLKGLARANLAKVTSGLLDAFIPGLGEKFEDANANPIAKPVVEKLRTTNKLLTSINVRLGGSPVAGMGMGGGLLGNIFGSLSMPGHASSERAGGAVADVKQGVAAGAGAGVSPMRFDPKRFWGDLKKLFSTKEGGLFAPVNGSAMAGIMSGVGAIGSMVGGMIGGRIGNTISMAGMGAQVGAMFGPWGALIGAGAGALLGFLGFSDPKRKQDKQQNMPQLQQGFSDAMRQLRDILTGVRNLSIDPDEAVSRAADLRSQIANGFGIQFLSKKYRKESQKQIAAKLGEADKIIAEIKAAADISRGAADRSKRILPEFAGGHYFADYFKPNGLLPGAFDGRDDILAMISRGEMVLNPGQQSRIRSLVGYDVFAQAGIPNYPRTNSSPKLAAGGLAGTGLTVQAQPSMPPVVTIYMSGVNFTDEANAWAVSDSGKRTLVKLMVDKEKGRA